MKALLALLLTLLPGLALAHPGHVIEAAGHDHILAGVAIGLAVGIAVWGALKGRRDDEAEDESDEATADEDPQEA